MLLGLTMQMQQLNTEGWAKTYLIWDDESKEAAIIDPVYDFTNSYLATIEQLDLTLTMCIATHTHAAVSYTHLTLPTKA